MLHTIGPGAPSDLVLAIMWICSPSLQLVNYIDAAKHSYELLMYGTVGENDN